jgi:hypothetical protein
MLKPLNNSCSAGSGGMPSSSWYNSRMIVTDDGETHWIPEVEEAEKAKAKASGSSSS